MLFGVIGDEWDGLNAAKVVEEIKSLGSVEELKVLINSPGGIVTEGLAIYNELATNPAKVVVDIVGLAASMASAIAMAGDTVRMAKNAMLMIHNPWNVAVGDAEDLRKAAEVLEKFGTSLVGIYAQKSGLPEDEIREMMDAETWLSADEALEKGFVDEVVGPVEASAFAELDVSELAAVPAALTQLIREGKAMKAAAQVPPATTPPAATPPVTPPAVTPPAPAAVDQTQIDAAVARAVEAEGARRDQIQALADRHGLGAAWVRTQVEAKATLEQARSAALDALASRQANEGPSFIPSGAVTQDERDKLRLGAAAWLIIKSGKRSMIEAHTKQTLDPGEFRGMSLLDLGRECLRRAGVSTRGMSKMEIAAAMLNLGARAEAGLGTRSDFPVLLENVLHKMLQAAYATIPDTWRFFCAEGSVSDFRPHPRLRLGSFGTLDNLLESGEFKQKHFPDAEKGSIQADTKGNIVGLTRQAIVNDDVDGFSRLITMLGRASALSIEVDVFALLALNSNLGPTIGPFRVNGAVEAAAKSLFHADRSNIGGGDALSAAAVDSDRVLLASQKDPDGNDYLNLRPFTLVVPIGLGSTARQINDAQYDPDTAGALKPNTSRGLFTNIVDTPRLSGTRRYVFADPAIAPVIEVVFLDGQSTPQLETEEGFDYDGIRWRVRYDYGVGAVDFRGAVTDAGA